MTHMVYLLNIQIIVRKVFYLMSRFNSLLSVTSFVFVISILLVLFPFNINAEESEIWNEEYDATTGDHNLSVGSDQGHTGKGVLIGWDKDGQYADIDINIPEDGVYTLTFRYAGGAGDAVRHLKIGDEFELERVFFGGTGGWDDFSTVSVKDVHLTEGTHTVSLVFDSSKRSSNWLNYDQLMISERTLDELYDWDLLSEHAEQGQDSLYGNFWNEDWKIFNECNTCDHWHYNYWWLAHALDTLVDGYERTYNEVYLDRASSLLDGVKDRFGLKNDFYDDMLWMGLAVLRLYEHTNDSEHEEALFILWEDIKTGWTDDFGGAIGWEKSQIDYKNTPSNAPAVILAARLYQKFGNEEDLEWAHKIYDWQKDTLVDPETGIVWDGINREGNGKIDKDWMFTYNQGVYIGASLELYEVTEDTNYLNAALQTAEATIDQFTDHNDLIYESGEGDLGLFKGILIRYLANLALVDDSLGIKQLILDNAKSAWLQTKDAEEVLFGASWLNKPDTSVELGQMLSGVMLMEHAALLYEDEKGKELPATATENYNFLIMGLILMSLATIIWVIKRRRSSTI